MKILLVGSFHGKNKGDEAIALAEVQTLQSLIPDCHVTIASQNPEYFRNTYAHIDVAAVRISNPFSMVHAIASSDAMIVGGGGLFFEPHRGHIFHLHKNQSLIWPVLCRVAQFLRTPTLLWGVGAEPIATRAGQRIIAWGLNAAKAILVRDPKTRDLFTSYGVTSPITVVADSAWLLQTAHTTNTDSHSTYRIGVSPHFGISILENTQFVEQYRKTFAEQLDLFAKSCSAHANSEFVFLPMHVKDISECEAIRSHMKYGQVTIEDIHAKTPVDIVSTLRTIDLQIGMRMHGTILATLAGVPSVSIVYANKVTETVQTIYGSSPVSATDMGLPYSHIDQLANKMLTAVDHESALRDYLKTFTTRMQKESITTISDTLHSVDLLR